ncbi:PIG-L family deacetylase [Candidatus Woesearchaeota archaeon]|nr:PIG-L family deacetylase [Candidatus Woesearchaeota archaeon]
MVFKKKNKPKNILVFCAHSDDQIFGAGATLARYASQGYKISTYIFSYGEISHPHLKTEVISKIREEEAIKADKVIGGSGVKFFGVRDVAFEEDITKKRVSKKIQRIIEKKKPSIIFTHSIDDAHPDHRETNKTVLDAADNTKTKTDVYVFDIWNPISIRYRNNPRIAIDARRTFNKKIEALRCFESQTVALIVLLWSVYLRAIVWGLRNKTLLAEVFYKVR